MFKYSREALLGLFDPSVAAPNDLDASLPIFASDALEPVANLPLTETEKKILALGSVNSEVQTRRTFSTPSNKGGVRGDFVSSRGGRGGSARRNNSERLMSGRKDASPERRLSMDSDIQDDPQNEEKSVAPAHFPEKQSTVDVLSSSAFASPSRQLSSNTLGSDPKNPIDGLFGGLSIASDLLASSQQQQQQQDTFLKSSFVAPIGAGASTSSVGLSDPPGLQFGGHRAVAPIVESIVSNWFYKDPIGNIQGPFTTSQMQDWYTKNFFSEDLPIKREQDLLFEPLTNLLLRFGRDFPFTSVDESESSSAAGGLFQQHQLPLPQPQFSAIPAYHRADSFTATGYSPFGGALSSIGGAVHHPLVGGPSRFNSTPSTAALYGNEYIGGRDIRFGAMDHSVQTHGWSSQHESSSGYGMLRGGNGFGQNVPDLAFGYHQQQHVPQQHQGYNPIQGGFSQFGVSAIAAPQFGSQVPANSLVVDSFVSSPNSKESFVENGGTSNNSNNRQNSADVLSPDTNSVLAAVTLTGSPQPIPQSPAKSPKNSPRAVSPVLRVPTPEPVVAAVLSPVVSPVKSPQHLKSPVVAPEPVIVEQKQQQQKVKSKKSKKNVVGMPAVEEPQQQQHQPSPVNAATPEPTPVEEKVTAIAATLAPWAGDKEAPKLSLKEIQELEQREHEQKEREKAKKAHARIMAEAQALAEQTASGIPLSGAPWSAGQGAKKSLAEIMKEEEKERKAAEAAVAAVTGNSSAVGGGKRYADHIAPVATNAGAYARASPAVAPVVVPVVAAAVPKASTSGWNVVGKSTATARPVAAAGPVVAAPRTVVAAVSAPKPVSSSVSTGGASGPSAPFIQWARQALAPLGRSTTTGIQADDFIQILLSIPTNEPKTMVSICDDTLGGLTAIDPVKFAEEFIRRRRADLQGPAAYAAASGGGGDAARGFDSGFVTVQKKKGKK
ncbi:UNVERIFIED_CONTAM: hypothetical protein HDU68_004224 [Siphonaria sp. JEL0065]|nr:hypothetical protein HDU68_004224 [Siphonaria sp. JEL0065]